MNDCKNKGRLLGGKKFSENGGDGVLWPQNLSWTGQPNPLILGTFKRKAVVAGLDKHSTQLTEFEVKLSWWNCLPYDFWATLQGIFRNEEFWEDIFPLILCLFAFALVAAHKISLI